MSEVMYYQSYETAILQNTVALNDLTNSIQSMSSISMQGMGMDISQQGSSKGKKGKDSKAGKALGNMGSQMGSMISGSLKALGPLVLLGEVLNSLTEPIELITEPFSIVGELLGASLVPAALEFNTVLMDMIPFFEDLYTQLGPQLLPMIQELIPSFAQMGIVMGQQLAPFLLQIMPPLVNIATILLPLVFNLLSTILPYTSQIGMFGATVVTAISNIVQYFKDFGPSILTNLKNGFNGVIEWFKNLPNEILNQLKSAGTRAGDWFEDLFD